MAILGVFKDGVRKKLFPSMNINIVIAPDHAPLGVYYIKANINFII